MKIDTLKTTPVMKGSPSCSIAQNKYIPGSLSPTAKQLFKSEESKEEDRLGREITYIPTLIFTPVLSSQRQRHHKHSSPRLSEAEMNDITLKVANLFLSDEMKDTNDNETKIAVMPPDEKKEICQELETPMYGRVEMEVILPRSNLLVRVMRSLRLMT